jgi:hypothetical protein
LGAELLADDEDEDEVDLSMIVLRWNARFNESAEPPIAGRAWAANTGFGVRLPSVAAPCLIYTAHGHAHDTAMDEHGGTTDMMRSRR